jgi:hypothetical protein
MTRDDIERMGAGRSLDAVVAESMGWLVLSVPTDEEDWYEKRVTRFPCMFLFEQGGWDIQRSGDEFRSEIWRPSADIRAAFEVFKAGLTRFGQAAIFADMEDYGRGTFFGNGPEEVMTVTIGSWQVTDKVEIAICKAYLLAVSPVAEGE